jgi:hypothetical protein
MSDAGKNQEPSMEEILASIRRIIAEDEAGRARSGPAPLAPRSTDGPSRAPRMMPNGMGHAPAPAPRAPQGETGEMVLDLTNMVAADGSVVTIAPTYPQAGRPAPQPTAFTPPPPEQPTVGYSGFSRRAPPPGPGAEPRTPSPSFTPPPPQPPAQPPQPMGFVSQPPAPPPPAHSGPMPMPLPPNLSEDSPSRRVFKRRHTAGSAFAELAQTGFAPPPAHPDSGPVAPQEPPAGFGQVPMGSVATELDMSQPAAHPHSGSPPAFAADPYVPPAVHPNAGFAAPPSPPAFAAPDPYIPPSPAFAPPPAAPMMAPMAPAMAPQPAPVSLSEDQIRAAVGAAAEPVIRSWLDANLHAMIEERLVALVQRQVEDSIGATVPQVVDQRIHQNVESNLGPYIEDRVGAHVDARLAAALEEKVTAAMKQQVAAAVNQQIAQAVTQQIATVISQQLQGQQQNVSRLVDDRVKSEIRGLFSRLAGN